MSDEELEKLKEKKIQELLKKALNKDSSNSMEADVLEADNGNFNRILTENTRLIIDFWAPWCMPCRMVEPIIYELAKIYAGRVKFARLNVDSNPEIAARFEVMSIPTLIMFENAVEVDRIVGALPKEFIERRIRKAFRF
ncbi:thioredoxin [Candidatus Bathyarchaeota archaeon]|nr:thioredoxin [Candidatus Bathyarchaeota archaeon]MBS7612851.1 thioredoxin [Candidatus Bathyarchaeota archaeon]MBS7617689.1 thioredoxin [Candidatus Bathyarchaeota archaeon]